MSEHAHPPEETRNGCEACRQRAVDRNALAEIVATAMEANGVEFAHLDLRYGVANALLESDWLKRRDEAHRP